LGGITEVAIVLHDGEASSLAYSSLINPGQHIPSHITALTGISNQMVRNAPSFDEVAGEIFALLDGRVFVAHNVNFDYSFLFHALQQSGYSLHTKKLCTVRYARKVVPGLPRYGLGSITRYFGISNDARHRAGGDAMATSALFSLLLGLDKGREMLNKMLLGRNSDMYLPPELDNNRFLQLPHLPGVYYFKNNKGKILYVGKAKNLRKRVTQHFANNAGSQRKMDLLQHIAAIDYTVCTSELHAAVYEELEIKKWWPDFNRSQKRPEFHYGLYTIADQRGIKRAVLHKRKPALPALMQCKSIGEGYRMGRSLASQFSINPDWFFATANIPHLDNDIIQQHNRQMDLLEASVQHLLPTFILIQKGKREDAGNMYSLCCIENGVFAGLAVVDELPSIYNDARQSIVACKPNAYAANLLMAEALANPGMLLTPG